MLTRNDVLKAKEIYLSNHGELLIPVENRNVGYRFTKQTLSWEAIKRNYSWKVYCRALSGKEALEVMDSWTHEVNEENIKLSKAIEFAVEKHRGQFRKSSTIPYILHPLEVLQILGSMGADINVMIAGVLHDTVEDTDATLEEITKEFGDDVAMLVASDSEDKNKSWDERKQSTIDELANADERVKMLIMADKLSNIRSIASDFERIGDRVWERFNAPLKKQAWYYDSVLDALYDMQFIPGCEKAYWEITGLFKDVFVNYYLDDKDETIYQVCASGKAYYLEKYNPFWKDIAEQKFEEIADNKDGIPHFYSVDFVGDSTRLISRMDAELTEDIWRKNFCDCEGEDSKDTTPKV